MFSGPAGDGCPGLLALAPADLPSSFNSLESAMLLLRGDGALRAFRTGRLCSLRGGMGGSSGSKGSTLSSPKGPRGPRESSRASSFVVRAPALCGVRGPRGERGVTSTPIGFGGDFGLLSVGCSQQLLHDMTNLTILGLRKIE